MSDEITQYSSTLNEAQMTSLAFDLVLYGKADLSGVLDAYDLDEEQFNKLLDDSPILSKEIQRIRRQVDNDPKAAIRLAASEVVSHSIPALNEVIHSQFMEPKDRIKAVEMAAKLADALPKEDKSKGTGLAVQINMGNNDKVESVQPINPPVEE